MNLLVKEFLRLVNIWRSYGQNRWLCHIPHSPCTFVLKDADIARKVERLVYYIRQKLLLSVAMLTGRLM